MRRDPVLSFLAGAALGAGVFFLLHPARAPPGRALAGYGILWAARPAGDDLGARARHLRNRARGLVAVARSRTQADAEDDDALAERVRAELGRVVTQPGGVVVMVEDGVVTLSGQVPAGEREDLIAMTRWVRGVRDLEDRLETQEATGGTPGTPR